jgi:hypothetical protein
VKYMNIMPSSRLYEYYIFETGYIKIVSKADYMTIMSSWRLYECYTFKLSYYKC